MNKTQTSTNHANKLAIKMATALIIGLIVGTSFIFLRENLISSGNSDTWTMINNLLFQDITNKEANKLFSQNNSYVKKYYNIFGYYK